MAQQYIRVTYEGKEEPCAKDQSVYEEFKRPLKKSAIKNSISNA